MFMESLRSQCGNTRSILRWANGAKGMVFSLGYDAMPCDVKIAIENSTSIVYS